MRVPLPDMPVSLVDNPKALDEALSELESHDATAAEIVKLRYKSCFSHSEASEVLGLSRRQAEGLWAIAKVWLFRFLQPD